MFACLARRLPVGVWGARSKRKGSRRSRGLGIKGIQDQGEGQRRARNGRAVLFLPLFSRRLCPCPPYLPRLRLGPLIPRSVPPYPWPVATDEGRTPDSAVQPSAIEAASERLEAYLENRQLLQSRGEARPEDLSSRDESPPPPDEAEVDRQGMVRGTRRITPLWIKAALAIAVVVAAAEGAYIAWGARSAEVPAAPSSRPSVPAGRPTEARRSVAPPVERANTEATDQRARHQSPPGSEAAANVAPTPVRSTPPARTTTGAIEVRSTPPGATVVFRGRRRGVTPLTLSDVAPGIHDVEVGGWFGSRIQRVTVRPGRTSVIDVTVPQRR